MCITLCASSGCSTRNAAQPPQAQAAGTQAAPVIHYSWPNGARAAVTLTYDDAVPSQLAVAGPALAKHGLRATFFITDDAEKDPASWQALAAAGNELAAHTMLHPCQRSYDWVPPGQALEDYDLARMEAELQQNIALLDRLQARPPYTFAYPCGSTWVGPEHESYVPLVQKMFVAARGADSAFIDPNDVALENTPAVMGDKSREQLLSLIDQIEERGGWLVLLFHGVGGDHLAVTTDAHEAVLSRLKAASGHLWIDTFGAVAAHIAAQRGQVSPAAASPTGSEPK